MMAYVFGYLHCEALILFAFHVLPRNRPLLTELDGHFAEPDYKQFAPPALFPFPPPITGPFAEPDYKQFAPPALFPVSAAYHGSLCRTGLQTVRASGAFSRFRRLSRVPLLNRTTNSSRLRCFFPFPPTIAGPFAEPDYKQFAPPALFPVSADYRGSLFAVWGSDAQCLPCLFCASPAGSP